MIIIYFDWKKTIEFRLFDFQIKPFVSEQMIHCWQSNKMSRDQCGTNVRSGLGAFYYASRLRNLIRGLQILQSCHRISACSDEMSCYRGLYRRTRTLGSCRISLCILEIRKQGQRIIYITNDNLKMLFKNILSSWRVKFQLTFGNFVWQKNTFVSYLPNKRLSLAWKCTIFVQIRVIFKIKTVNKFQEN